MDYLDLNPMQLDALREVGNIGIGNSATALSQLLNKKVDMTVPNINIVPFEQIYHEVDSEELVVGILVRVLGNSPGNILFIFSNTSALSIIKDLTGTKSESIDDMGMSVLCEMGNIISASYMNAISKFTNLTLMPSVPAVTIDMLGAILSTVFIESGQYDEYVLDIETSFVQEGINSTGNFYYVPMPGSLEKILSSLGI